MSQSNIIPFPPRPNAEQERLQQSLSTLQAALDEQRRALRDWRFAMTELGISVAGLGQALGGYQGTLAEVETRLTDLRQNSQQLSDWADTAIEAAVPNGG
jgi:uncharacterized membrane-anchored protein YhcB (DUF1043 family)